MNFTIPAPLGPEGGAKTIKMSAIFKNLLLYSWTSGSQTVGMVVISMEPFTKLVKFVAPGSGVVELGWGSVIKSSPFPLLIKQINQVHGYDDEGCLCQNCEICGPRVRGSGVRVGLC